VLEPVASDDWTFVPTVLERPAVVEGSQGNPLGQIPHFARGRGPGTGGFEVARLTQAALALLISDAR
jgi:hypothetical protein